MQFRDNSATSIFHKSRKWMTESEASYCPGQYVVLVLDPIILLPTVISEAQSKPLDTPVTSPKASA